MKIWLRWTYNLKDQFVDNSKDTNIFYCGVYNQSCKTKLLYEVLDKLDDTVLGFDTDSCWYIEKEKWS